MPNAKSIQQPTWQVSVYRQSQPLNGREDKYIDKMKFSGTNQGQLATIKQFKGIGYNCTSLLNK